MRADRERPPLVILAGSDRRPGPVPRGVRDLRFTVGYKAVSILLGGRPIVSHLVERARAADVFDDVLIAGPEALFRPFTDARILQTDGNLAQNLRAVVDGIQARYGPDRDLAILTCDVLPSAGDLRHLVGRFQLARDPSFWFTLVRAAEKDRLGRSRWKLRYAIRPTRSANPVPVLPGHLVICRPSQLRTRFLFKLFHLAYQVRNRELEVRRQRLLSALFWSLVRRDILNLVQAKAPTLTYTVLRHSIATFLRLKRGALDLTTLERSLALVFLKHRFRSRRGAVRGEITDRVSIAKDLDTVEEIEEMGGTWHGAIWTPRRRRLGRRARRP